MSGDRFTLDTNVLVYAVDSKAGAKRRLCAELVDRAAERECVLTVQALGEFFHAVTRKGLMPRAEAAAQLRDWELLFPVVAADRVALLAAAGEAEVGRFSWWDALLLATADGAGCTIVISEDMAEGSRVGHAQVRHPFSDDRLAPAIIALLG
jgi:predicted nucleic acid-binding protein